MLETGRDSCVLLVIDMQSDFPAAKDPTTVRTVIEELQYAGALKEPVVILTFSGFGELVNGIHEMVDRLQNETLVLHVEKSTDDGSKSVFEALEKAGMLTPERLRVVGVNINFCVKETVSSLSAALPNTYIEVIANGCYCEFGRDFSNFNIAANVRVVIDSNQHSQTDHLPTDSGTTVQQERKRSASPLISSNSSAGHCWDLFSTFVLALLLIVVFAIRRPVLRKTTADPGQPAEKIRFK